MYSKETIQAGVDAIAEQICKWSAGENYDKDQYEMWRKMPSKPMEVKAILAAIGPQVAKEYIQANLEGLKKSLVYFESGCRDCADEAGVCPRTGIACGGVRDAVNHVMRALLYYLEHPQFIGDTTD